MKLYEHSFRDVFHQFILLPLEPDDSKFSEIIANFPNAEEANALLLYGYIDHEAGLTFEVLCAAFHDNETTTLFAGTDEISVKLRSESIGEEEIILLNKLAADIYDEKVEQIHDFYKASKGVELCRKIKELDPYRHFDYPDDVAVIFYDEEKEPEYCWVRCEDCRPPRFFGTLLNEPQNIPDIHKNEKVVFNLLEVKDGFFAAVFIR
ncbi:DUF2314 domain-containing protein [Veillonella ratti]|uniref:DUF2314 domain-containing protein n=1 Tax=Veillonella ratti TaxID=103892 RepID=UPI000F8C5EF9|nr:DUF2314 domain-containing protein [Veillonella ratti]